MIQVNVSALQLTAGHGVTITLYVEYIGYYVELIHYHAKQRLKYTETKKYVFVKGAKVQQCMCQYVTLCGLIYTEQRAFVCYIYQHFN